jgi:hypothetical protein
MEESVEGPYVPAARAYRRACDTSPVEAALEAWVARLDDASSSTRFRAVPSTQSDGDWMFAARARLARSGALP